MRRVSSLASCALLHHERHRLGTRQDPPLPDLHLDLAGGHLRVDLVRDRGARPRPRRRRRTRAALVAGPRPSQACSRGGRRPARRRSGRARRGRSRRRDRAGGGPTPGPSPARRPAPWSGFLPCFCSRPCPSRRATLAHEPPILAQLRAARQDVPSLQPQPRNHPAESSPGFRRRNPSTRRSPFFLFVLAKEHDPPAVVAGRLSADRALRGPERIEFTDRGDTPAARNSSRQHHAVPHGTSLADRNHAHGSPAMRRSAFRRARAPADLQNEVDQPILTDRETDSGHTRTAKFGDQTVVAAAAQDRVLRAQCPQM